MTEIGRLGKHEKKILIWILYETECALSSNNQKIKDDFERLGIKWNTARVYGDTDSDKPQNAKSQLSASLKTLISKKLVNARPKEPVDARSKASSGQQRKTAYVKLTDTGCRNAINLVINEGKTLPQQVAKLQLQGIADNLNNIESLDRHLSSLPQSRSSDPISIAIYIKSDRTTLTNSESELTIKILREYVKAYAAILEAERKRIESNLP